ARAGRRGVGVAVGGAEREHPGGALAVTLGLGRAVAAGRRAGAVEAGAPGGAAGADHRGARLADGRPGPAGRALVAGDLDGDVVPAVDGDEEELGGGGGDGAGGSGGRGRVVTRRGARARARARAPR